MLSDDEDERQYRRKETGCSNGFRSGHFVSSKSKKSHLTLQEKETVLTIKKVTDPFNPRTQRILEHFVNDVEEATDDDLDLSEVGLLLSGVTKIYTAQVDSVVEDVQNLLAIVTRTKKASIEKKKVEKEKKEGRILEAEQVDTKKESCEDKLKEDKRSSEATSDLCKAEGPEESENLPETVPKTVTETNEDSQDSATCVSTGDENLQNSQSENIVVSEEGVVPQCTAHDENSNGDSGISVDASDCVSDDVQTEILNEIPGPTTRKRSQLISSILNLDENGQPIKKKRGNGIRPPPTLISCFEELRLLEEAGLMSVDDEEKLLPPLLTMAFRFTRKRHIYTEDTIKLPKKFIIEKIGVGKETALPEASDLCAGEGDSGTNGTADQDTNISLAEANENNNLTTVLEDTPNSNLLESTIEIPEIPSSTTFSSEDQTAIQECINELHYLPFTFELSKSDLASAFSRTVERMSRIFQKNNVQVTRNMVKEATRKDGGTKRKEEKPGGSNGKIHPAAHSLGDIYNTFVKSCREECESFITNEKTILERTKETSFAESRANIRAMIAELQRNIVPKFARVPLMAENTPEFFLHVTNFEKKMKKVLDLESKKEEFDVRKYEREVLENTAKESSDLDRLSEDFLMPQSPLKPLTFDEDDPEMYQNSQSSVVSTRSIMSTRSSVDGSQSSSGSSWVPIKNLFQHMKSIDRTEAARLFYAVLALLSYQNLDINYDQLYSAESAALLTQQLRDMREISAEEENDKCPRGVKIVTSRCPDVDKEEVFVAALTSESRDEAFRHLLAQESRNIAMRSGAGPSSALDNAINGEFDEGIAEAMADFVEESGTIFAGRLEGRRRKRKTDS